MRKKDDKLTKRQIEKLKKEKEKRKKSYSRFGHSGHMKHSTMGMKSCMYGIAAALLLALCIFISFLTHGQAAAFIGVLGLLCIAGVVLGIIAGFKGMRERDRNYITCKIGLGVNLFLAIGLLMIYVGGF